MMTCCTVGNVATMDVIPRHGWTHIPPVTTDMDYRNASARYVFYTHTTNTAKCHVTSECCAQVLNMQYVHMNVRRTYENICSSPTPHTPTVVAGLAYW